MYNSFYQRTKKILSILCVSAVGFSGITSCTDAYDLDDGRFYPEWLGGSIYEELKTPEKNGFLTGTFTNFTRLIDDLGYAETLNKTGSKTLLVANDEAFERFYKSNTWGVTRYEDLSEAMKKQLLYSAMLDNAILIEMFSNVSQGATQINRGVAMKHTLASSVIDTITAVAPNDPKGLLPQNNSYWDNARKFGIHMVLDGTKPMMVHFTQEQMTSNNITTSGDDSDFAIITGSAYNQSEGTAFIFRDKVIKSDVKCKNGYIQQMQDVVVPPGNLAELIRTNGESNYFSQMLERFACPFYNATITQNYNDWAAQQGLSKIDSIFEKRYFSSRSQGSSLTKDPYGNPAPAQLPYDPGWNTYTNGAAGSDPLSDIATMFVPTDEAMEKYFLPGGEGAFLLDRFASLPNTKENLSANIQCIPLNIVQAFLDNLMQNSFVATVPSKFGNVMDDASDPMGISTEFIAKTADNKYNVKIANNGVAYMLNKVFAPNRYVAVSAPALLNDNMKIVNDLINDGYNGDKTLAYDQNFYAYLLAMSANYAFFIPTDDAFGDRPEAKSKEFITNKKYYIDPTYLMHDQPRVLRFYVTTNTNTTGKSPTVVACSAWKYNPATGEVGDSIGVVSASDFKSQLLDILNYNTVVLAPGKRMGENHYYKTKHGGAIYFDGTRVISGGQIDNGIAHSMILQADEKRNGVTYTIDHLIAAPQNSVYTTLDNHDQFSDFMAMCNYEEMDACLDFASDKMSEKNPVTQKYRRLAYHPFVAKNGLSDNVNYFNSYNYTVLAPNNEAMAKAYAEGLPKWEQIYELYQQYHDYTDRKTDPDVIAARNKALAMVEAINSFIRYHFVDNSTFADNVVEGGEFSTSCADTLGIRSRVQIYGGNGQLTITDNGGQQVQVSAQSGKLVNAMTRDYEFNNIAKSAKEIRTSSFAVVHEISTPLKYAAAARYDALWTGKNAKQKLAAYRKLYESKLYKIYDEQQ